MDTPDATPRRNTTVTNRRAAIGRALRQREQVPADPAFLSLTDDEQQNGLALFSGEDGRPLERDDTFDRVPAHGDPVVVMHQSVGHAIPLPQKAPPPATWLEPLLAAIIAVAVVVFGAVSVRIMHTAAGNPFVLSSHRTAGPVAPALEVPGTRAVAPTTVAEVAPSHMTQAAVRETETLSAPVRSLSVSRLERDAHPVRPEPAIQPALLSKPEASEPLPVVDSSISPLRDGLAQPVSLAVEPRPAVVPATLPREESSLAPARPPAPETAIQTVLSRYRTAYGSLDAAAARAIWPTVDTKALRKAFDRLEEQDLVFDSCAISVSDARAVASCVGLASYVPRAGNRDRHEDQRQWEFTLSKVEDAWLIDAVSTR